MVGNLTVGTLPSAPVTLTWSISAPPLNASQVGVIPAKESLLEEQPASSSTEAAAIAIIDLDLDKEELLSKGFLKFTLQSSLKPDF